MANIITVAFEPKGAKPLKDAINALAQAQGRLEKSSKATANAQKKVTAA